MSSAQNLSTELRGILRMGLFSTLSPIYLSPLLSRFSRDQAAVQLSILEGSKEDILSSKADPVSS